jgi:uncharacterized repeat protein (TIGR01451 family)
MKKLVLLISIISLSYFVSAQCNVTITGYPVSCFNGSNGVALANPSGGTPPYTYAWTPSGGNTQSINNLVAGTYTCTVTDGLGCVTWSVVTITQPTAVTANASAVSNGICSCNGIATVAGGGGVAPYSYHWSPTGQNTATASYLCAGTYTATVTDAHGCSITSTVVMTTPPALTALSTTYTNITCNGMCDGSISVVVGGGTPPYTYLWYPTGQTTAAMSGLCADFYVLSVTDNNGCQDSMSNVNITQPAALACSTNVVTNATCGNSDGSASVVAGGGTAPYTYLWNTSPPQTTATAVGLAAGVYDVTITDAHGCTISATRIINGGITATLSSYTSVSCANCCDGAIAITASGGSPPYTYLWSPNGGTSAAASNLCAGAYTCTVSDANSCLGFLIYTITDLHSLSGTIYFDTNQNGIRDTGEPPLSSHRVQINPGNIIAYTNGNGDYTAYVHAGSYTVSYVVPTGFTQTSLPVTYAVSVPPAQTGLDFGSYSAQSLYGQQLYVWHHSMRCAPSQGYTSSSVRNVGTLPESGSITMVHSSNIPFNSSSPAPAAINGDTLIWYYTNLQPNQTFDISLITFNDPAAGNTVWYTTVDSVTDLAGNPILQYTDSFSFVVTCSCDPNDKEVNPPGFTAQHYTAMNSELTYTLNFQNTGNDTAFNVSILDTLSASLNLGTFKFVAASDSVSTELLPGRVLRFTFSNIQLPDSNVDFEGSKAYVAFSIKPNTGLPDPTVINNRADIYFDSNPKVATNTAYNTFTNSPLSISETSSGGDFITIYPNPFHSSATVILSEQFNGGTMVIYDAIGNLVLQSTINHQKVEISNLVLQSTINHQKVEISNLTPGIYLLKLEAGNNKAVRKLIVY